MPCPIFTWKIPPLGYGSTRIFSRLAYSLRPPPMGILNLTIIHTMLHVRAFTAQPSHRRFEKHRFQVTYRNPFSGCGGEGDEYLQWQVLWVSDLTRARVRIEILQREKSIDVLPC